MDVFRGAVLIAATAALGLNAGLFYGFSCSVMVSLRGVDDRTFVTVMQKINRDIQNGWFFVSFIGSLLFTTLALVLFVGRSGSILLPVGVGLAFYVLSMAITIRVNIPMNIRLDRADPVQMGELTLRKAREGFEAPWFRANTGRALASTGGFLALCWALVQFSG
ncbi:DUF1772 domain-containing protein [Actinocrispum wychmicini]|nr:DUF1772 domain-containing protein [Actinocrispum wychmicini]